MGPNHVMTGSRCPFKIGAQHTVPISETETIVVQIYHITPETGEGLATSADGKEKFRCFAYGWSQEDIEKMPKLSFPVLAGVDHVKFFKDLGYAIRH